MTMTLTTPTPTIEQIIQVHQRPLWRFIMALGCQPAEAEDLAQETFVGMFRGSFQYRGEAETAAWLRRAAKNLFISSVRKRNRAPVVRNLDDVDIEWGNFEAELDGDKRVALLRRCLEGLNDRPRRALELRYREDLSREQIAAQLDMKEAGVRTLLERARDTLRDCVKRRMASHGE